MSVKKGCLENLKLIRYILRSGEAEGIGERPLPDEIVRTDVRLGNKMEVDKDKEF